MIVYYSELVQGQEHTHASLVALGLSQESVGQCLPHLCSHVSVFVTCLQGIPSICHLEFTFHLLQVPSYEEV